MTQDTGEPEVRSDFSGEVEETVTTRANRDGSLTRITEITNPDGSRKVVEETIELGGAKNVVIRNYPPGVAPTMSQPETNQHYQPTFHSPPPPPPQMNNGGQVSVTHGSHNPPVAFANQPKPSDDFDEETCCCGFPEFGKPAECEPLKHPVAKEGVIEWAFCPTFSWLRVLFITSIVITILGIILMIISFGNGVLLAFGIIFFLGGIVMFFIFGIWKWNADKQAAYRLARGKRAEAVALWKDVDSQFHYQAKDKFFECKYGGKILRVLRDGTIEIDGTHREAGFGGDPLEPTAKMAGDSINMASNIQQGA